MRACLLHQPAPVKERPLQYAEFDKPTPRPGETLIRIRACGVCRTDLHVVEGDLPSRLIPVIPGHQVVGVVDEIVAPEAAPSSSTGQPPRAVSNASPALTPGDRVGVAWLNETCGCCRFCTSGRENLCDNAQFTGWTRHGGYAEYIATSAAFVYPLPSSMSDEQIAPLLCAGIIGYRCLTRTGIDEWEGAKLGLYGFGAAGHIAIQIARHRGAKVYVCTRDRQRHQTLAEELGAEWVGGTIDSPPVKLDASIIFAPAGEIIPPALAALEKGGALVLGGIHMSPTPPIDYKLLYEERVICSVTNNTRGDGRAFLAEAAEANVQTHTELFDLSEANDALIALKHDAIRGAAVLMVQRS